jgi:hypothetical protein
MLYFVHINKTGGSSIEVALELPMEHKTAQQKIKEVGWDAWRSAFTFSVVRNPWDKVVSHYCFRVATNQTGLGDGHLSFGDWVRKCYHDQHPRYFDKPMMFMPQLDWLTDQDGQVLVDFIARYERLSADMELVQERIGRQFVLGHYNKTLRQPYRNYYDDDTRSVVQDWFARDIEAFGYAF